MDNTPTFYTKHSKKHHADMFTPDEFLDAAQLYSNISINDGYTLLNTNLWLPPDGLVYLASPYSHPYEKVKDERFILTAACASDLFAAGIHIFSPIVHCHPMHRYGGGLPGNFEFWEAYDRAMIGLSEALVILKLDGWHESKGVRAEYDIAVDLGLQIYVCDPDHLPLTTWRNRRAL